ncbi:MAG: sugar ABC transporter permease, partial [Sphaerochaetaceae bacterium]|nr:sugar ABC transporter permease [Sphaerochaetaceae bacterium]
MLNAFWLSLHKWNLLGPKLFVGLENFKNLLQDTRFLNSFKGTLHFTLISVISINILAFIFALMLSSNLIKFSHKGPLQSAIFLPVVLSVVAAGIVWKYMYQSTGLMSVISAKILGSPLAWLTSTKVAPYSLILIYVWKSVGYYMVMYIAGLLDIPEELYEAATIDGANFWHKLFYITIPSLRNTFALAIVSCLIFTFGTFPLQFVVSGGGPSRATEVVAMLIYLEAFRFSKFGYSAAISVIFFLVLMVFAFFQLRMFKSGKV